MKKIKELLIDWDNIDFADELGVDIMSLVDNPAIQTSWMAFAEEECSECEQFLEDNPCQSGYVAYGLKPKNGKMVPNCVPIEASEEEFSTNDYPESVKDAAARGIRLNEAIGNKCATQVGKIRAQQLAKGENISFETVKRMYSYLSRAKTYYNPDDTEACGTISYLLWGGPDALKWSERVLNQLEEEFILEMAEEMGEYVDYRNVVEVDLSKEEFTTVSDVLKGVTALDILGKRVKKDEPGITKYRYAGPPAERNYCKAMLRMNKLYTKEEINQMSFRGLNKGFGHNGRNYSIFNYKGGVNCKHYWEEVLVFKGDTNQAIIISKGPAAGRAGEVASASNNYWRFANEEEQIVIGPAMIPNKLILRKDELGNPFHVYFSEDTIKKIAKKFFETNNHNNTDVNHDDDVTTQNTLLESWIVEDPEKDKSSLYGFNVPKGTWMVSYKINDDEVWQKIKAGELNGFSVTGNFIEKDQN